MQDNLMETVTGLHCLNGLLLLLAVPAVAVYLLVKYRLGRELKAYDRALLLAIQVLLLLQVYMGVLQLHSRARQDIWHYTFGMIPLLLLAIVYWVFPRWRGRWMLAMGLTLMAAGIFVLLAYMRTS